MSPWLPAQPRAGPGLLWRFTRYLFLLVAIIALGYSGWIYLDEYWHERSESEAFDRAREAPAGEAQPAKKFRAKIRVPRLGLAAIVEEGVGEKTLRRAAGHIPDTALPGRVGNVVVAAHRDTLFRPLRDVREHDRIILSTLRSDYSYEVISTSIVNPDDLSVLAPSRGQKTLTLITCYPFSFIGRAPQRFIVRARQIDENVRSGGTMAVGYAREANPSLAYARIMTHGQQREERIKPRADTFEPPTLTQAPAEDAGAQIGETMGDPSSGQKTELRKQLLSRLNSILSVRDTPRGLVATVRDNDFNGLALRATAAGQLARVAAIVGGYPGLRIEVGGHTDSPGAEALSGRRAESVREVLMGNGLPTNAVVSREFGNTRPLTSNASATGRQENRRVEIVISGEPIGNLASWDRTYTLTQR